MATTVNDPSDPRLAPYRDLKDRRLAREGGRFIVEGEHLVRRLLASDFEAESVLVTERRAERFLADAPGECPVYVVPEELLEGLVGFHFHRGVMACGLRRRGPTLGALLASASERSLLVVCPDVNNAENLGAILRVSAAFGADGILLGESCCDPFARRAIRVSMGAVFSVPITQSEGLAADLASLRERWGFERIAAVLDETATPLRNVARPGRAALLLGGEADGLSGQWLALCDRRVTIPMSRVV